jgi:hypothetical protein
MDTVKPDDQKDIVVESTVNDDNSQNENESIVETPSIQEEIQVKSEEDAEIPQKNEPVIIEEPENVVKTPETTEEEVQNEVSLAKPTEFTYTSLTSFEDETNGCDNRMKPTENGHSESIDNDKSMDKQNLDKILEKLKTNQITNKEVVDYILNLLVGGEFDLEKNFIIKNVNNILYMMQVIKCASSSLKAEIWSLFTAILRKSQRNLQACVDVGLVEAALHELKDADVVCAGELIRIRMFFVLF